MSIRVTSVGSSSSGNSYIIQSGDTVLLLDVGLSARKIREGLSDRNLTPEDVDAILITHEHVDHVRSIRAMSKCCTNARVLVSNGTASACSNFCHVPGEMIDVVTAGDSSRIGTMEIRTYALSHDAAEPVGYSMSDGEDKVAVVTDTGIITDEIRKEICLANKLVFESNYEEQLLLMGPYPYEVKRRILGEYGHLSNEMSGNILSHVIGQHRAPDGDGIAPEIMLAHLSTTNNTPWQARETIETILAGDGHSNGEDYRLIIAAKEGLTEI